jgi:hypothetical protein
MQFFPFSRQHCTLARNDASIIHPVIQNLYHVAEVLSSPNTSTMQQFQENEPDTNITMIHHHLFQ